MKGLYRYLSPAAPDQSGAVSVLFEQGGLIVVLDAGGCTGNICGFDEPRWFLRKSAVYSAGIRDMDAILGRDDKLIDKLQEAVDTADARFIALIGTPVPSVIGTDYRALARLARKRYGLPVIWTDTAGIDSYEKGASKAYLALIDLAEELFGGEKADRRAFPSSVMPAPGVPAAGTTAAGSADAGSTEAPGSGSGSAPLPAGRVLVWGATPLDLPAADGALCLRRRIAAREGVPEDQVVTIGMDSRLEDLRDLGGVRKNLVCAPSGFAPARRLAKAFGTPWEACFPVPPEAAGLARDIPHACRVLILHQQVLADGLREVLEAGRPDLQITTASLFTMDPALARPAGGFDGLAAPPDTELPGEDELVRFVKENHFDAVIGDPIYFRALKSPELIRIPLAHFAQSGGMYRPACDEDAWII